MIRFPETPPALYPPLLIRLPLMRLSRQLRDQFSQHHMRTYGRKNGFISKGQSERLRRLLPLVGLDDTARIDASLFAEAGPIVMEIGFGNGDFLAHLGRSFPKWNLVGIEVYLPGVAKGLSRLETAGVLDRVRISQYPAQYVLSEQVPEAALHGIYINHPDPWPKARHAKRRLIQKDFAALLASRLEPGGFIRLATDKRDLAEWMRDILDAEPMLENTGGAGGFIQREPGRPFTKFERRGQMAGLDSIFLEYRRKPR